MPLIDWLSVGVWIAAHWHIVALLAFFWPLPSTSVAKNIPVLALPGHVCSFWGVSVSAVVYAILP